jgi:PhnB protein
MAVNPIPKGFRTLTPYLLVPDAAAMIEFLKAGFGAVETYRSTLPDGRIMHVQMTIGDSALMMGQAPPGMEPATAYLYMYLKDADAAWERAVKAGASPVMPVANQFYGDRMGGVKDPAGNTWWIATHIEELSQDELTARATAAMKEHKEKRG